MKKVEIKNLLMIKVSLLLTQNNIVLKTDVNSTAAQLLEKKAYWQYLFFSSDIKKDEKWFKVIAHNIFTEIFNNAEDMKLLKEEIKIYNLDFKLLCLLSWLSSKETRQQKMHFSVVLIFKTEKEAFKALRSKLLIAEISIKTAEYTANKSSDQCKACQRFEHL